MNKAIIILTNYSYSVQQGVADVVLSSWNFVWRKVPCGKEQSNTFWITCCGNQQPDMGNKNEKLN